MFALLLRAITPSCWPGSLSMRRLGKMGAARAIGVGCEGPRERAGRGRRIRRAWVLLEACRDRLPAMRLKHPKSPPDGFLVFDGAAEVGHSFGASISPRIAM
jgi:hypothetical protein